ncbi:MAG: TonB-dependent receptor [Sulfuricella sp.]|nr:TonB-dependent receptor [Sulfuricella sp.]
MFHSKGFSVKFCHTLLASSVSCLSLSAAAQPSKLTESSYLDDVPVVLTVSRLTQPVNEAPAAVTVIDRQMIKDSGAWDLSEVFRLVPGMYVAYHAARFYSTDSIVSYRGLMSETMSHRMQVLVDGRSVYSPLYGGVIWSDIPVALDDIERIEVIRSPNAASYGANSFVGVINVITRHSAETQGKAISLSAGRGRSEGTLRYGGHNGDLTYRLTLGLRNDQGEDADIRNPTTQNYIWTKNKFDDKRISLMTFRADYQLDSADTLEFQFGYNGGKRQGGEVLDVYAPDKQADNHFEQFQWRRALVDGGEFSLKFYHMLESSSAALLDRNGAPEGNGDVIAHRYDLEAQHTFSPSKDTRLVWGGSVRYDKVFAPYDLGIYDPDLYQDRTYRLARLFGNLEWRVRPDLVLNAGAMLESNNYTGSDITPRVALNWHFLPGHTLRVSRSYATRTPSVYEKRTEEYFRNSAGYFNLLPQNPERVVSNDIGYLGKLGPLDVDFRLFHDAYTELIADRMSAVSNNNLNSGRATIKGFETQLKWQIGTRTRLIYALSHSLVASPDVDKIPYTNSVPTNSQSLMLSHRFDQRWSASLVGYQVGETHFSRTDYAPAENRDYFIATQRRWDSRLAYAFKAGDTNGEVALIVQNLANANYFEFRHDNQVPGRTAWLNLKLDL